MPSNQFITLFLPTLGSVENPCPEDPTLETGGEARDIQDPFLDIGGEDVQDPLLDNARAGTENFLSGPGEYCGLLLTRLLLFSLVTASKAGREAFLSCIWIILRLQECDSQPWAEMVTLSVIGWRNPMPPKRPLVCRMEWNIGSSVNRIASAK